jgi:radical SAM superfamily enzyme YgiQ (UPF0313 family)
MKIGFYVPAREHLGVELLSAVLKRAGHTTEVFFDPRLCTDGALSNPTLAGWFNVEDLVVDEILNAGLDLLCFSVVTDTYAIALRIAGKVRRHRVIPTAFGGVHCSCVPERVVVRPEVDYVVVGEGEDALVELCEAIANGDRDRAIGNVWHVAGDGAVMPGPMRPVVEDLDSLPFVDKDVFFAKVPRYFAKRYMTIASRGCMNSCTFCNNSVYKRLYDRAGLGEWKRQRSVDSVMTELTQALEKYDIERIYFMDEIFTDNREWVEEFCDKYGRLVGKPFWCYGHTQFITKDLVGCLERAGCREINIGVQTIRESTRREYLRRGGSNDSIARAIRAVSDSGVWLSTGNIMELPGQTVEEAVELAAFYNDNRVDLPIVSFLRYYPRTEIVDIALNEGILTPEDVETIEEAKTGSSMYYVGIRSEHTTGFRKARLLTLLTTWVPRGMVALLIRRGWWRFLPASGLLNLALAWVGTLRPYWTGKRPFPDNNYTSLRYLAMMMRHGLAKLRWKLRARRREG